MRCKRCDSADLAWTDSRIFCRTCGWVDIEDTE